jgi:hypothetical protein
MEITISSEVTIVNTMRGTGNSRSISALAFFSAAGTLRFIEYITSGRNPWTDQPYHSGR